MLIIYVYIQTKFLRSVIPIICGFEIGDGLTM